MFKPLNDLTGKRILISNDDGIDAYGIGLLEKIALRFSDDVWVVAPDSEQSGSGHALTISRPLRVRQKSPKHFSVDGTPTDCVLVGVHNILKDKKPDIILSGINNGGNIGEDVTYSGTVAVAMEGTLLGIPSVAFSQRYLSPEPPIWDTAEAYGEDILRKLLTLGWSSDVLINVNFPAVKPEEVSGIEIVRQGKRKIGDEIEERVDPRGRAYVWIGPRRTEDPSVALTDLEAINRGAITITPLTLDLTHHDTIESLRGVF